MKRYLNRIVSFLLCMAMVLTSIQVQAKPAAAEDSAIPDEPAKAFLIKNGNFAYGMDFWEKFQMEWEGYDAKAEFHRETGMLRAEIKNAGQAGAHADGCWTIELRQACKVYAQYQYHVSFKVKSTLARKIRTGIFDSSVSDESKAWGTWNDGGNRNGYYELPQKSADTDEWETIDYTFSTQSDYPNARFCIRMGAEEKDKEMAPHEIFIKDIKVEVDGARNKFIQLMDDFSGNQKYEELTGGTVADKRLTLKANGKITYKDIPLEKGKNYAVSFAARKENEGKKATVKAVMTGAQGKQVTAEQDISTVTERYRKEITATSTGPATLTIETDGDVYLDNIGVWIYGTTDAMGTIFPRPDIMMMDIIAADETPTFPLGNDVSIAIGSANGRSLPEDLDLKLYVDGEAAPSEKYSYKTVAENNKYGTELTVDQSVFKEVGIHYLELEATGYEKSNNIFVKILPSENRITNGNFEDGVLGWSSYFAERNSCNVSVTEDHKLAVNIGYLPEVYQDWNDGQGLINRGEVEASVLWQQKSIYLESGKKYIFKFKASCDVTRPIAVEVSKGAANKKYYTLTENEKEYELELEAKETGLHELTFLMGSFAPDESREECPQGFMNKDAVSHTIQVTDCSIVEDGVTLSDVMPNIIGVDDGAAYNGPVTVNVGYKHAKDGYELKVTKDNSAYAYKEGAEIKEEGTYTVTATAKDNTSLTSSKTFTLKYDNELEYEKYVVISNKATEKVFEAHGTKVGAPVIQSAYQGKANQFWLIEKSAKTEYDGGMVIRSLATGKVIDVLDDSLILNNENGEFSQLWEVDRTVHQGYVKFVNLASGKAIDLQGNAISKTEGLALTVGNKNGNGDEGQNAQDSQRWDIMDSIDAKDAILGKTADVSSKDKWSQNAIITPVAEKLNPAGKVTVEFYPLAGAEKYDVYFDGKNTCSITQAQLDAAKAKDRYMITKDGTIKLFDAAESTEVAAHTLKIVADGSTETKEIQFYLSKKGVGWATLHRTQPMNLSWYYRWSTNPAVGTDKDLTFVPMLWGNYGDSWLADPANKEYGTILSFNEPDWSDQSNVPVSIKSAQAWLDRLNEAADKNPDKWSHREDRPKSVEEAWPAFMNSGLRVGSPATAIAAPYCNGSVTMNEIDGSDRWWYDFMDLMESKKDQGWDYDFVAIHSYDAACDAKGFLKMVDDAHELTGKPIWITEFGVAEWNENKVWKGHDAAAQKKVIDFMTEVVNGLEARDFVEHYAWFPFDQDDDYGGASSIFNYTTGELNELGQVYAQLGVPEGFKDTENYASYSAEVPKIVNLSATETTLKVGDTAQVSVMQKNKKIKEAEATEGGIVSVDNKGNVTAKKEGKATVTVTTEDGYKGTINFTVKNPELDSVTIIGKDGKPLNGQMQVGDEMELDITTNPEIDLSKETQEWKSSNPYVVRIDSNHKITAANPGVTEISATVKGTTGKMLVIVYPKGELPEVSAQITKPKDAMKVNETMQLSVELNPADTKYTWKSETEQLATVDDKGVVTAKAPGTACIAIEVNGVRIAAVFITITSGDGDGDAELKDAITQLNKEILDAKTKYNEANYTKESWEQFMAALEEAEKVAGDETATVKQVNDAITNLNKAIGKLANVKPADGQNGNNGQNAKITMTVPKTTICQKESIASSVNGASDITYTSSNPKVAAVDKNGVITGVAAGKATITAVSASLGSKASVNITVVKPTVKWNVTYKTVPLQLKNKKKANKTTVLQPLKESLKSGDSIKKYTSSKTKIATVKNSKGKLTITPKKTGKTKITVATKFGATATFTLKVQKKAVKVSKITVDNVKKKKLTLKKGKSFTLKTTKKYITALDKVTFSTNKKSVAKVSSKGKITAKKKGKAKITVKCKKKKAVITVTVK